MDESDVCPSRETGSTMHTDSNIQAASEFEEIQAKGLPHVPNISYNFKHKRRGLCILINQMYFDYNTTRQKAREGTDADAVQVTQTFTALGFDVRRYDDLRISEMHMLMSNVAREDHTDADCISCVILSHGTQGRVYGYDGSLSIDMLVAPFKGDRCRTLNGKPKLFFIQACRGTKFMHGETVETDSLDDTDAAAEVVVQRIPTEADFMMAFSTVPGYFSWRNNVDGSWFIRAVCKVFKEQAHQMELAHMMTYVNRVVAYDFESCTSEEWTSGMKQIPAIVSMLTKHVYFNHISDHVPEVTHKQSTVGEHEM